MDTTQTVQDYVSRLRNYWLPLSLGVGGFIFLGIGLMSLSAPTSQPSDITFTPAKETSEKESLASKTLNLNYNNQAPTLKVTSPDDGQQVTGPVTVSGQTDSDNQVFVNSTKVIVNSNGNFSAVYPLNEGDNNLIIKAIDKSSNSTEVTRKVTFTPSSSPSPSPSQ